MKIKYIFVIALLLTVFFGFSGTAKAAKASSLADCMATVYGSNMDNSQRIQCIMDLIADMQAQLKQLQAQGQGSTAKWCYNFTKNLRIGDVGGPGDIGNDVSHLQEALSKEGFSDVYKDNGSRSAVLGENTASAVSEFQEKYASEILTPNGLRKGNGYVGPSTRKKLNALYGCNNQQIVIPDFITCAQDVKQCPDGSYVSRTGPKCEFAKCPETSNISGVIYFYWDTCPYCAQVNQYIKDNNIEQKLKFTKLETYNNAENKKLQSEKAVLCGLPTNSVGVPFVWDGKNCYTGKTDVINFFAKYVSIQPSITVTSPTINP